jgi:hypothetical protein
VKEASPTTLFGDFQWLSFFRSDWARLAALALVCVALVAIFGLPALAKVLASDRADRRSHERRKLALVMRVEEEIDRRKKGRLDLDA